MPESRIEEKLSRVFQPHLQSADETHNIRTEIAAYVESLQPQKDRKSLTPDSLAIPNHVTGIRRQYLRALHENLIAQQEYANLKGQQQNQIPPRDDPTRHHEALKAHLDVVRLRKQHHKYQILSHYMSEAESLADRDHVYDLQPTTGQSMPSPTDSRSADQSLLSTQAQELTRNLEVAILQANHQLNHERRLLEEAKSNKPVPDNPSTAAKLRALTVTQAELNKWVEHSLAKCDTAGETNADTMRKTSNMREPADHEQMINEQYQKYLEARRQLLEAVSDLKAPLLVSTIVGNEPDKEQPGQRTGTGQPEPKARELSPIFPYLDYKHLPLVTQHESLKQAQTHISNVLSRNDHDLSEQLLRLSEESHLLPSYPILAKALKSDHESDNVESLLHAWKFAVDAADTAVAATAEKQIRAGEKSVEEVEDLLAAQKEIDIMWKRLEIS